MFRDRIKNLVRVRGRDLLDNPKNFRKHPVEQVAAMRGILEEIGHADALAGIETESGVMLIDGHMRKSIDPDELYPVLILDLNEEEADLMLATFDSVTAKGKIDATRLDELLEGIQNGNVNLAGLLADLGKLADDGGKLKPVNIPPAPTMTWVLIGIPTVRFGDIAPVVEQIAVDHEGTENFFIETTVNDNEPGVAEHQE